MSGGENVASREVEAVLHSHPGVADVAVIGLPDPRWGERVAAVVVRRPGDPVTADELVALAGRTWPGSRRRERSSSSRSCPATPRARCSRRNCATPWGRAEAARYDSGMDEIGHPVFDADNHYYEALDAFTRHLDPRLGPRTVQWAEIDGRKYHVVGGRVSRAVVNPTFNPIAKAGAMHDYFRGNPEARNPLEFLREREPIRPEYRDRDARLGVMDEQDLAQLWLFPTLGMLYEELLKDDPEAVAITFTAFNRWLEEDWGFAYQDRIFAAPYLSLCDVDWAVHELEWALDRGARVDRPAPGRGVHRDRAAHAGRPGLRPVLGPGQRSRHHGRRPRR